MWVHRNSALKLRPSAAQLPRIRARHGHVVCKQKCRPRLAINSHPEPDQQLVAGEVLRTDDAAAISSAWNLLADLTKADIKGSAQAFTGDASARERLRQALKVVYSNQYAEAGWSPAAEAEVLLGIVASDSRLAVRALRDWCEALGLEYTKPTSRAESIASLRGPVYVKYNSRTKLCYMSPYAGRDRGVLLQLAQAQFGHFPLGLFDETMSKPPPAR